MRFRSVRFIVGVSVFSLCFPWLAESASEARAKTLRVHYAANRQGEVEPCGCAVNPVGGLGRMAQFLRQDRATDTRPSLFVDSGDAFFSSSVLNPTRIDTERSKAKLIARGFREMGLDALTPGERDLALGLEELRSLEATSGAVFVSANLVASDGKTLLFPAFRVLKKDGVKIGVTGVTDEESVMRVEGVKALPAQAALEKSVSALRNEDADFIVVLSHLGLASDRKIAKIRGVSAILGAHSLDALANPEMAEGVPLVQVLFQGRQIGVLDLESKAKGNPQHRVVDLGAEFDAENEVTKLMALHKAGVRDLAVNAAAPKSTKAERPFVAHANDCRGCHELQHDFWKATKHSSAYLVLFAKNQHFDAECIGCHSLGFKEPGGYASIVSPILLKDEAPRKKGETPFVEKMMKAIFEGDRGGPLDSRTEIERYAKLKKRYHDQIDGLDAEAKIETLHMGVQCEHCHGNRNGHPGNAKPTKKLKVVETSCRTCHRDEHDPNFNFAKKVKLIACPLIKR